MDFSKLIRTRYSVREYQAIPVEEDKKKALLEAARLAETAANKQPYRILVLEENDTKQLDGIADIYGAPLVFIILANRSSAWVRPFDKKNYGEIDATIATDYVILQATELGLGTLWIGYFDPKEVSKKFEISDDWEPIHIVAIGYAKQGEEKPVKQRKSIEEIQFK